METGSDLGRPSKIELGASVETCDVCGGPTYERNCKIICVRCGYTRNCGDP